MVGSRAPVISRIVVVLPAPDGPIKPENRSTCDAEAHPVEGELIVEFHGRVVDDDRVRNALVGAGLGDRQIDRLRCVHVRTLRADRLR